MRKRNKLLAAGLLLSLVSGWALALPPFYRITRVGSLGGVTTDGSDMNSRGQVTGVARTTAQLSHAFLWNGIAMRDLGTLGGSSSSGRAINTAGQVTGSASTVSGASHAFLWNGSTMRDLGTLGGSSSEGLAINAAGQVTGSASTANGTNHAFLWDGITMRDLGTFGGTFGIGLDINNAGQVTGSASTAGGVRHAFLWNGSTMRDLGTLGGSSSGGSAINASGQVTGSASTAGGASHAFLWSGSTMRDLGTLGGSSSGGAAINIFGQVTGSSGIPVGADGRIRAHAFLWDGIAMRDLGTLGGPESRGGAISAAGQVTGSAFEPHTGGQQFAHAFLWDGTAMYDLNDLIDPADPLRSRVLLIEGRKFNNRGQILVKGLHLDEPDGDETFVLSPVLGYHLKSFTINKSEVAGCMNVTGKVTLSHAAPAGGVVVTLKDTLASVSTPLTVKILEGQTSKSFTVKTTPVSTAQSGVLGAILGGSTITKDLKVRPMGMSSVTLTPNPVVGTRNAAGTAKLECKAGPGSIQVALTSNNAAIAKPTQSSITVPAGVQSAAFTVTTSKVTANKKVTISATSNDIKISKVLTVTP
jgi:probable HAF family extracellular repeat protein